MENLQKLVLLFVKEKKDISQSSAMAYAKNLKRINTLYTKSEKFSYKDLGYLLTDYKNVIKLVDENYTNPSTNRNFINSILVYVQIKHADPKVIDAYTITRDKNAKIYEDGANTKSDKVKDNWITLEQYDALIDKLYNEIKTDGLFERDCKGAVEFFKLQDLVLLMFYRNYPIRNDLADMQVFTAFEYKKHADDKTNNYLVIRKDKFEIVLNVYKTSKVYDTLTFDITYKDNPRLFKLIRRLLEFNDTGYFIVNKNMEPITPNQLSKNITGIFYKHLKKKVGTTMIRDITLTEKFSDKNKEQETMSKIMGNSIRTQNMVYIKK